MIPLLAALLTVQPVPTNDVEGHWRNPSGTVVILIASCGNALCGHVQWASDKAKADALDGGTSGLIGKQLLSGFTNKGNGRWRGRLFIPDLNHRSKAEIRLIGADRLKVTGCAIGRMLCKSQLWTRTDPQ